MFYLGQVGGMASVEASTLRAPAGLHDDRADAFALAVAVAAVAWQREAVWGSERKLPSSTDIVTFGE